MSKKRWVLRDDAHDEVVEKLSTTLKIDQILARLLAQRGITSYGEAKDFFRPSLDSLHDPFLLKDMDLAVTRIEQALEQGERILVYGDYDVDGTTAVALVYEFLNEFHPNIDYYIPDRYKEGYGISYESIDYARKTNVRLIISLDCGIKAHKQIHYAIESGIDFIVIDHHRPGDEPLTATAVVDPKQPDCFYPYKELSGCGLGFKLAQAFYQKRKLPFERLEKLLDLVVVSIAADVVPITGENRVLAYYGLIRLNLQPRAGLESILFYSNVFRKGRPDGISTFTREIGISDLMFMIGPKINAAGRIENGKKAVDLLVCQKMGETHELTIDINDHNTERRSLDTDITRQAMELIARNPELKNNKATVLFDPDWHKGVIGIVASRLIESYYRPTIIFTESNGLITGSARSVKDFDIYDAIDACSDLLEHFGGHKYAAGLSLKPEKLDAFIEMFTRVVEETITEDMLIPQIEVHAEINLNSIEGKFFRVLKQFAPFGPGNPNPVFVSRNCTLQGNAKVVGNKHLKFRVTQPSVSAVEMPAIAFQQGHQLMGMVSRKTFDIAYQIEENEWNGKVSLQLNVKDIRFNN
ncbi:MAG: single-stranded-DNA-specific exonuclease RecJ [Bacteroidia bacterium]|nr:MAG: single-stranded-DNA-specific exonuclease RecJ [Bacteroidia bacterium]